MKILIRATNWVGDAIMALPALRAVRGRFPDAEITILARPYVAAIYENQEVCDNTMFVETNATSRPNSAHKNLTWRCCFKMPLRRLGSPGVREFQNVSATRAMVAASS